jgi:hypothetical protein
MEGCFMAKENFQLLCSYGLNDCCRSPAKTEVSVQIYSITVCNSCVAIFSPHAVLGERPMVTICRKIIKKDIETI